MTINKISNKIYFSILKLQRWSRDRLIYLMATGEINPPAEFQKLSKSFVVDEHGNPSHFQQLTVSSLFLIYISLLEGAGTNPSLTIENTH